MFHHPIPSILIFIIVPMAIASPGFDSFPDTNSNNSAHDLTRRQKNNNNNPSPPANESVAGYVRYCPWCYTNIKVIDNPQNHLDQCNVVVYQPVDTTGTMNQLEAASVAILSVDFKALYSWDQILLNNVTTLNPTPLMSVLWKERLPPLGSVMISPYAMTQEVKATNPEGRLPPSFFWGNIQLLSNDSAWQTLTWASPDNRMRIYHALFNCGRH